MVNRTRLLDWQGCTPGVRQGVGRGGRELQRQRQWQWRQTYAPTAEAASGAGLHQTCSPMLPRLHQRPAPMSADITKNCMSSSHFPLGHFFFSCRVCHVADKFMFVSCAQENEHHIARLEHMAPIKAMFALPKLSASICGRETGKQARHLFERA